MKLGTVVNLQILSEHFARELKVHLKARLCPYRKHGVLRKLKHIFPNTYQRINIICSPAKVGLVVTDFNYQPGS